MADIDLKTETPDSTLPTTGFLFGADSQAAASPSVYSTQTVATTLLGSTSLTGATITADAPVLNMSQTWNASGVTFTGLRFNAATGSNTGSAAGSLLMDLQLEGSSLFSVRKDGALLLTDQNTRIVRTNSNTIDVYANNALNFRFQGPVFAANKLGVGSVSPDIFLTRRGAANLCIGNTDAASPVAQTLSVQSVSAGTSNKAGEPFTITGSQGTGTGAGGSIIFQVAPAGSSGTAQNALVDALTILSTGQILATNGTVNYGFLPATGGYHVGSTSQEPFIQRGGSGTGGITIRGDEGYFAFSQSGVSSGTRDVLLVRDAANTLALRNGTNAQAFRVYNTFTSATNFERANIFWDSNVLKIGTEKGSAGGTARALEFQTDGTTRLTIATNGAPSTLGPDGLMITNGNIGATNNVWLRGISSGVLRLTNVAANDFGRLQFGGTTSSFPAIKRSTTSLQAVLADDTGFTNIQGKLTTDTAYTAGAPTATGYIVLYDSTGTAYKIPAEAL